MITVTVAFDKAETVIPPSNKIPSSARLYANTSPAGTST
jgi:hypothetical protein